MAKFFAFCTNPGTGECLYFDWELRQKCLFGELDYNPDSHTSIADYFGYKGAGEDVLNKYTYNPFSGELEVNQINRPLSEKEWDREGLFKNLNFKEILPALVVKKMEEPPSLSLSAEQMVKAKRHLKAWAKERFPNRVPSRSTISSGVQELSGKSVWLALEEAFDGSFPELRNKVRGSVNSPDNRTGPEINNVIWAYAASFFRYYRHTGSSFNPALQLWCRGLFPVFDGGRWILKVVGELDNG